MASFVATVEEPPVYRNIHDNSGVITIDITLAIAVVTCLVMLGGVVWAGLSFAWKLSEIKNELFGMSSRVNDKLGHLETEVNKAFATVQEDLKKNEKEMGNLDARITIIETHLTKHGEAFVPARTRR